MSWNTSSPICDPEKCIQLIFISFYYLLFFFYHKYSTALQYVFGGYALAFAGKEQGKSENNEN